MRLATAAAVSLAVLFPGAADAASRGAEPATPVAGEPVPGEVLVGFAKGADGGERAAARRGAGVTVKRALSIAGVQLVRTARGESVDGAIARLERDPSVRYAEPNRWRTLSATVPNDTLFGELWGLDNSGQQVNGSFGVTDKDIDAPEAWDVFTGGDTKVAVVDEGVAYDHPDLAPNMWTNPGEVVGNGVDDDGNGYVDDVHGFDIVDDDGDPRDFGGHGTHVAGTIAAAGGNGRGVTGVSWTARLMAVRALGPTGGSDADVAEAFVYAADNGARVINASLGGPGFSTTLHAPITAHPNTLFVVAAGNDGTNNETGSGQYPCNFDDSNLICVAATTQSDGLASFSNFGATSVDLGAPGTDILSTAPDRDEVLFSDDFEADDFTARWLPNGSVTSVPWGRTGASAATGSSSMADSPGGNYAASADSYVDLKDPLDLSGAHGCELTFKARRTLSGSDRFVVDRSLDGGATYQRLLTRTGNAAGYQSFSVELAADGQPSVTFSYGVESTGGSADGVNVDDVAVRCVRPEQGPEAAYAFLSGTSMATPHVAGAAALLLGRKPSLTVAQLRSVLLATGDPIPALAGKTVTGRRLNLDSAVTSPDAIAPPPAPSAATQAASAVTVTGATLNGSLNPRGSATSWQFEYGTTAAYGSTTPLTDGGAVNREQAVTSVIVGLSPSTTYHVRLVAVRGGERFPGADATFTTGSPPAVLPPIVVAPPVVVEPPIVQPPVASVSLAKRAKAARLACSRKRGRYRCRVSLTRGSPLRAKLILRRGRTVLGRGRGRVGRVITLRGRKARRGRYKVELTLIEGSARASRTKRIRVR